MNSPRVKGFFLSFFFFPKNSWGQDTSQVLMGHVLNVIVFSTFLSLVKIIRNLFYVHFPPSPLLQKKEKTAVWNTNNTALYTAVTKNIYFFFTRYIKISFDPFYIVCEWKCYIILEVAPSVIWYESVSCVLHV